MSTRSDRNNNPGNLRPGAGNVLWDGQTGTDPDGFAVFANGDQGDAAARKQVLFDYNHHSLKTPAQLASKYTKTDQGPYAQHLADALRIGINDDAKLSDPANLDTYMGRIYSNEGGTYSANDSATLGAMGFAGLKTDTPSVPADHHELGAMGLTPPVQDLSGALPGNSGPSVEDVIAAGGAKPSGQAQVDDVASQGVASILKAGGTKDDVLKFLTDPTGLNRTITNPKDVDAAIAYAQKTGQVYVTNTPGQPGIVAPPGAEPGALQNVGAGVLRGLSDVGDNLHKFAADVDLNVPILDQLDKLAETHFNIRAPGKQTAYDAANRAGYQSTYGNSLMASAGRLGGNMLSAIPLMAATEGAGAAGVAGTIGESAAPVMDFLAGRAGSNMLTRGASMAARGATSGAGFNAIAGDPDQSLGNRLVQGAAVGAVAAPALGALGAVGSKIFGRAAIDPAAAGLAQQALDRGIPVRGSQLSNNSFVRAADSLLGQTGALSESNAAQRTAWNTAVGRAIGSDASNFTPDVMEAARVKTGQQIGDIAGRHTITNTEPLLDALGEIEGNAKGALENASPIHQQITNVMGKLDDNGHISGDDYKALIRHGGPLDTLSNSSDGAKRNFASDIRDALDDAWESSASPEDAAAFRQARLQYKNIMTIAPIAAKAQADGGELSPALLQGVVNRSFKGRAFRGADELGVLGNIGQRFLKPAPSSGTAQNNALLQSALSAGRTAGGIGAGMLGFHAGLPPLEAIASGAATMGSTAAIVKGAARFASSPAYVNRLISSSVDDNASANGFAKFLKYGAPAGAIEINRLRSQSLPR